MSEKILLEPGMVVYHITRLWLYRYTVSRVTEKRAYISRPAGMNRTSFNREIYPDQSFYPSGHKHGYSISYYQLENEELKRQYIRQHLEHKFSQIKVKELTDEHIIAILEIVKKDESDI
jgi:hypothetical protein